MHQKLPSALSASLIPAPHARHLWHRNFLKRTKCMLVFQSYYFAVVLSTKQLPFLRLQLSGPGIRGGSQLLFSKKSKLLP